MAQSSSIRGKVLNDEGKAAPFANIILYAATDSSMAKAAVTEEDGRFILPNVPEGKYWLSVSVVGLQTYQSEPFSLTGNDNLSLPTVSLQKADINMDEVVVTAKRPLVEVKPDKTVFNVEGSINATGYTAFELLRKSPGVIVDNEDNIILQGKNGVQVYIDGKPSPLSQDDLAAMLKTVQSTEIDAIEIITNPSAKYDAEGNAGIINIRMKRNKAFGSNANIDLGYAYGKYPKYNASLGYNFRNAAMSFFSNYSFGTGTRENYMDLYRKQAGYIFDQKSVMTHDYLNNSLRLGSDFYAGKHHILGFLVNGYINKRDVLTQSTTPISNETDNTVYQILDAQTNNNTKHYNGNINLNYRFDNKKRSWSVDADYGHFQNQADAFQPNYYLDETGENIISESTFRSNAPTDIQIGTFKVDHELPAFGGKIGAGIKLSLVNTDNTFDFYDIINEEEQLNSDRSNYFNYQENINAAYLSYQTQKGKWGIQAGLRTENTNSSGKLSSLKITQNDTVNRNYTDFFPSAGLTYQFNQKNSFRLNYSRRIDRPSYQDLNPFEFKLDELTYSKGNPFLRPQYSHKVSLTHSFNYRLNTSLNYSYTQDYFTRITDTTEATRSFIILENLSHQRTISANVSYPMTIAKWWNAFANVTVYNTRNVAAFEDNKNIDLNRTVLSVYSQQTFLLPKEFSFEVSGHYTSPSIWGGNYRNDAFWGIDMGLQKKFWDKRANLKISFSDVFHSMQWRGYSEFGGLYMDASGGWESQQIKVNLSFLLGNTQLKTSRKRKTGLEEESKRVKTEEG